MTAAKNISAGTENVARLIVTLYDGVIKFLKLAIRGFEASNYEAAGRHIKRTWPIIPKERMVYKP